MKKNLIVLLALFLIAVSNTSIAQISRVQMINTADAYSSFIWTASNCNLWSGTYCGGANIYKAPWVTSSGTKKSMPYCWGGWTTQLQYNTCMSNCKSAGQTCSAMGGGCGSLPSAPTACAGGHDCSGLISRAWALSSKYSTSSLPSISSSIPLTTTQPGDILNNAGSHVRLLETNYGNGNYRVIEASANGWNVGYHTYSASQLSSYTPRCPNNSIVIGGCSGGPCGTAATNDHCGSAITLYPTALCSYVSGSTCGAMPTSPSSGLNTCVLLPDVANDVWFKFVATQTSETVKVQSGSNFDAIFEVLSNVTCGSSYTQIHCSNTTGNGGLETATLNGLTIGYTYWIRVYNNLGYTGTNFQICVVGSCTAPNAVTVVSSGTICGSKILTASGGTGGTIYWQNTTNNGTSTTSASITKTVTTSGTYYFRAHNACGWGAQGVATVTINAIPSPITVSGAGTSCNSETLTANGGSGGTIYWQSTTSNGTSTSTPIATKTIATSGTYYFRSHNTCGWGTQGAATVTINATPSPVTISAGGTFCNNKTITASGGIGGTMFWQSTTNNGTSTTTPTSAKTVTASGTYYFRARNGCGWSTQAVSTVSINTVDTSVTVNSTVLIANANSATYQWIACPTLTVISGATNKSFVPSQNGSYAVIVTQNGCTDTSLCTPIVVTGISSINKATSITLYPNPTNGLLTIKGIDIADEKFKITLTNPLGQLLKEKWVEINSKTTEVQLDINEFAAGTFFLSISSKTIQQVFKIQKL